MTSDKFGVVESGRVADHLIGLFKPYLEKQKQKYLTQLIQKYRSGCREAIEFSSILAAYCSIEDLEAELKRSMAKGNQAAKEAIDAGSSNDNPK